MQYVAKVELFERRWQGWILSRVGAFPIRRGQSDETAMETARLVLGAGRDRLHLPRGNANPVRLACDPRSGASGAWRWRPAPRWCPFAVHGTEQVRRGWRIRPRKVKLRVGRPMTFPRTEHPSPGAGRHGHGSHLAQHRASVGVARRPATAAQGGGDRRGELGHRGRRAAGARRARGPARDALGGEGRGDRAQARERAVSCPGSRCPEGVAVRRAARHRARRGATSSASRCPRRRSRPRSARSAIGSARAPRCCC